jgi:hypothetical protein
MKNSIVAFVLIFSLFKLQAQPPGSQGKPPSMEERIKKTNETIQKEIQLSASQKLTIEKAFRTFFISADKVRKDNPPPNANGKVAMEKLEAERDETIKTILTAEQFTKYKKAVKSLRPPMKGENRPPPPQQKS